MGKIDELIKQFCPDGVQLVSLDSVCSFKRGTTITAKKAIPGEIPVIAGGQTPSYYHNEANRDGETIAVAGSGAYAGFVSYWDTPIFLSDAFSVEPCSNSKVMHKYLFYYLRHNQQKIYALQKGAGVPHVHGSDISKFKIPLPPLAVQKEIVEILDTFTGMIDNLQKELEQRQKQFEHYRNQLLVFKDGKFKNVTIGKVGDIGKICMCKRIMKSQTNTVCGIPFYKIGTFGKDADAYISKDVFEEYKKLYSYPKKGDVLMSASGTIGRTVVFDGKPSYFQDSNIVWVDNDEKKVLNSYLKYYYQIAKWETQGGTIKRLYNSLLANTEIMYPSLETQQEIVDKLDTFEALISNIKQEIELRQKQYEYYREKLLSFE